GRIKYTDEQIEGDPVLFYGMVKCVEIIGEAAYKLTDTTRNLAPDIPWSAIIGMRHVLVHGYYQIKPERLFATMTYDLIPLREQLVRLVNSMK
ncbi:MAG: DUF86 domain-containing protein, partial [Duncaniella sp.]|nr:DUF86 domain-containing protein [Duncaniella sp.]